MPEITTEGPWWAIQFTPRDGNQPSGGIEVSAQANNQDTKVELKAGSQSAEVELKAG